MDINDVILLISRGLLAYILLSAGWNKIRHIHHFVKDVDGYQLLPTFLVKPFATALPYIEIALGIILAMGWWTRVAASGAAVLQLVFILAISINLLKGRTPDCGCSGGNAHQQINPKLVARDFGLFLLSIAIAIQGPGVLAFDSLPYGAKNIVISDWLLPLTISISSIYIAYLLGKQLVKLLSLNP